MLALMLFANLADKLSRMPLFPVRIVLACDPDANPEIAHRLRNQQKAHQTNEISIECMSRSLYVRQIHTTNLPLPT